MVDPTPPPPQSASSSDSSSSAVSSQVSHWLTCREEAEEEEEETGELVSRERFRNRQDSAAAGRPHLEQSFSFSREFLGNVFFPSEEGFFFNDLHVVEVDKVAQQHP